MLLLLAPWFRSSLVCFLRLSLWRHKARPLIRLTANKRACVCVGGCTSMFVRMIPNSTWSNFPLFHTNILFIYNQRYWILASLNKILSSLSPWLSSLTVYHETANEHNSETHNNIIFLIHNINMTPLQISVLAAAKCR